MLVGVERYAFRQSDREAWQGDEVGRATTEFDEYSRARTSAERPSLEDSGSVHAQRPAGVHSR